MDTKELLANGLGLLASFVVLRWTSKMLTGGPGIGTILATGAALAGYVCHSERGGSVFPGAVCASAALVNLPGRWVGTRAYRLLPEGRRLDAGSRAAFGARGAFGGVPWDSASWDDSGGGW